MDIPYLNKMQFAQHMIHMLELIKEAEQCSPSLAWKFRRGLIVLEHDRNALESQLEAMECIR